VWVRVAARVLNRSRNSYQWQLCNALGKSCANIAEATGSTLKLTLGDVSGTLAAIVTARNVVGLGACSYPGDRAHHLW
jgi:hypothetical protein